LAQSGPHGYMAHWLYVYPLVTFFMLGRNEGLYYNASFYLIALIFLLFQEYLSWTTPHVFEFKIRFLISLFLVGLLAYIFEYVRHKFQEGMKQNQLGLEEEKAKLADAIKEAERANQTKSAFLANMSHELRTPLNHIMGFTELVLDKNFGELNETQEEYLTDVYQSSQHLLSLINDILDLSKVEAGKLELIPSQVNLRILLENSLIMIKETAMKHGIKTSINTNGIPDTITADERKLKQIIYNLLSNAVKFTPDGGEIRLLSCLSNSKKIRDQIESIPTQLSAVDFEPHRDWVQISVQDSGIGFIPEDAERIFCAFEQADSSKSRSRQGTGLGLSLTKQFIKLHGGNIWAESEGEGKGSVFHMVIPK